MQTVTLLSNHVQVSTSTTVSSVLSSSHAVTTEAQLVAYTLGTFNVFRLMSLCTTNAAALNATTASTAPTVD